MTIKQYSLGQLRANCYLLVQDKDCLIIDPGDEASFILEEITRKSLNPVGIIATHGHFDHIMAVGEIQLSFKVPFYIFKEDLFLIRRLRQTAKHFLGYDPVIVNPGIVNYIDEQFSITDYRLRVIHTPGHTPGSCSIYLPGKQSVFTGDTLFKQAEGDTSHVYSDKKAMEDSLKKLFRLPEETIVYPGHGELTSIGQEAASVHF